MVRAGLERQARELLHDVLGALHLLTLPGEHGGFLVEGGELAAPAGSIEGLVVVANKGLRGWTGTGGREVAASAPGRFAVGAGGGGGGRDLEGLDHSRGRRLRSAGLVEPIGRRERFPPILSLPPPNSLSALSLTTSGDPAHAWLCPPKAAVDPLRLLAGSREDSHVALLTQFLRPSCLPFPRSQSRPSLLSNRRWSTPRVLPAIKNLKSKNRLRFAPSLPMLLFSRLSNFFGSCRSNVIYKIFCT